MPQIPPAAWTLAQRVLVYEIGTNSEPTVLAEAADRVDSLLRGRLRELIGLTGYSTLISRALSLAQAEAPAQQLSTIDAGETMGASGIRYYLECAVVSSDHPTAAADALTAILAHIIALLITFIGEDLASRLVYETWPELTPE